MSDKKITVLCGAPICTTEVNALIARLQFEKRKKRNKSDRKRDKSNRWR